MESGDGRHVVEVIGGNNIVDNLGLFARDHGTNVTHDNVVLDSPIRPWPLGSPSPPAQPSPHRPQASAPPASETQPAPTTARPSAEGQPRPAAPTADARQATQVPDPINGYAAAFSQQMAGPPVPLPLPQPAPASTTANPTMPKASAPPLSNTNEETPQQHVIASRTDSGRLSRTLNDVAETLEK